LVIPILVFIVGLAAGSFMNVVIYRVPRNLSLVLPGSFCPLCRHPLVVRDNIPLLSFLLLCGRCRYCGGRISLRYPLVEILTGIVFLLNFSTWGLHAESITRTLFFMFVTAMAFIDGQFYIIPDRLSLGGLLVGIGVSFLPGAISPADCLMGALFGGGLLLMVAWIGGYVFKKEAMGMGDVKMMAMIGSFVGWRGVLITLFAGSLLGTIVFGPLNIRGRKLIPFGVFLAIGGIISFYFADPLVHIYLSTFFW